MGVASKRVNEIGSFWGLIIGFLIGTIRFIWQSLYESTSCVNTSLNAKFPPPFINMHFLHFSIFSLIFTCSIIWTISIFTKPIPNKYIEGLTYTSKVEYQDSLVIPSGKGWGKNHFCAATDLNKTCNSDDSTSEEKNDTTINITKNMNPIKKAFFWVCGVEKEINKLKNPPQQNELNTENIFEFDNPDPFWCKVCDISAVFILAITCFIIVFFNKF